jgi:hypothetical protein
MIGVVERGRWWDLLEDVNVGRVVQRDIGLRAVVADVYSVAESESFARALVFRLLVVFLKTNIQREEGRVREGKQSINKDNNGLP